MKFGRLEMAPANTRTMQTPRFWLEPKFEALLRDADSLAFEFRGAGVKAMTEEDHVAAGGNIQHSGKAGPAAQRWADKMTEKTKLIYLANPNNPTGTMFTKLFLRPVPS